MTATPAAELRQAAVALAQLATAAAADVATNGYWESEIVPASDPDGRYAHGVRNGLGGEAGDLAAVFTPGVVLAMAKWLENTAIKLHHRTHPDWQDAIEPHALALARQILGAPAAKEAHDA